MPQFTAGVYRHYKGNTYDAFELAIDEATEEAVVLYRPQYDCPDLEAEFSLRPMFVRSLEVFNENVEHEGKSVPRFELVKEQSPSGDCCAPTCCS